MAFIRCLRFSIREGVRGQATGLLASGADRLIFNLFQQEVHSFSSRRLPETSGKT